ncbi:NmrA family transcriptional regulator [Rhizodiscina lignyota]|uniref:NmrA family transcriptional regulator n=1 Tax=Rhizodiscina lignyota TaxID=1504668 RepID=A0A9P4I6N0_9PEZI|nr:NmrA family transcriptional regulator [Rhizodiscina lignyota]
MSKTLVVFGATGNQGGSLVDYVLNDRQFSKEFKVRGLTRNPSGSKGQALANKGAEVARLDYDDPATIKEAVKGAHTVFAMTNTIYDRATRTKEIDQGKAIGDACVEAGVKYLLFSTSQRVDKISNGKLQNVTHFTFKARIEDYIRTLPIKSSFYSPGSFMQNFLGNQKPKPSPSGDGSYAVSCIYPESTEVPLIDIDDTGKFIGAILADPDKYEGKVLSAADKLYNYSEIVSTLSKATGKNVVYKQLPVEVFKSSMPPGFNVELVEMFQLFGDYGYYGEGQKEKVEWSANQARGKLTSLEEFFKKHPLTLE